MKHFWFFLILISALKLEAQVQVGFEQNIQFYLPLTETAQVYEFDKEDFKTNTFSIYSNFEHSLNKRFNFSLGLNYKQTSFKVDNIIKEIEYKEYNSSSGDLIDSGYFVSNVGYNTLSQSFGFNLHVIFNINETDQYKHQVGLTSSTYIIELFEVDFNDDILKNAPQDQWYNYYTYRTPNLGMYGARNGFYFSTVNLSKYYRFTYQINQNFSLAARISLGTNLYSDWDQFKKYAWLGVGLEMGFGKVKLIGGKEKKNSESQK